MAIPRSLLSSKAIRRQLTFGSHSPESKSDLFRVYAPPKFWGPWIRVKLVIGAFKVRLEIIDNLSQAPSSYDAEVAYFDEKNQRRFEDFGIEGAIMIQAGDPKTSGAIQEIKVRFRSHSTGQVLLLRVD